MSETHHGAPQLTVRLFAAARDALGTSQLAVELPPDGLDVAALLAGLSAEPGGARLAALLPTCRVWRNGEPAGPAEVLAAGDEVAILPPVSGGCGA